MLRAISDEELSDARAFPDDLRPPAGGGTLMAGPTRAVRRGSAVPVFTYVPEPGVPPVSVFRIDEEALERIEASAHAHDFPGLVYFERSGGTVRARDHEWPIGPGDAYLIGPGAVVDIGEPASLLQAGGWGVFFAPDALGAVGRVGLPAPGPELAWRTHPLLSLFADRAANAVLRLQVPQEEQAVWAAAIASIEREVCERRPAHRQAAIAHLIVLLVSAARLAAKTVGHASTSEDELLSALFAVIDRDFRERLSLRDVAEALHLSPGHLTTTVRRKTGRTVQDWIVERRMGEARRLLVETDLSVTEVARRVGYADAAYFGRTFRRTHDRTPRAWRAAR